MAYIVNRDAPYSGLASLMAMHGQHGDTELVHMSKPEVRGLSSLGKLTINPDTGLPEAFNLGSLLPIIANVGLAYMTMGASIPAQMAVMGAGNFIMGKMQGKSSGDALLQGAMAAGTSGLGRVLTGAASGAASGLGSATGEAASAAGTGVGPTFTEGALALPSAAQIQQHILPANFSGGASVPSGALLELGVEGFQPPAVTSSTPSIGSKVSSWIKDNPLETASLGGTALEGLLGDDDSEELPSHTVKPFTDNTYSLEGGPRSIGDEVLTEEEILRRALEGADEESDLYNPSQYQYVKQPDDFYTTNLSSGGLVNTPSNSSHTMFSLGQGLAGLATGGQVSPNEEEVKAVPSLLQNLLGGMTRDQFSPAPQQQFETVGGVANFDGVTDDFLLDLALKGSGYQGRESASSRSPNSPAPKGYTFLDSPLSFIEKDVPITPNIVEPVVAIRENMDGDPDQPEPTDTNPTIEAIADFLGYGPQGSVGSAASSGITGIDITGEGGIGGPPGADDTTDAPDTTGMSDEEDSEGTGDAPDDYTKGGLVGLANGGLPANAPDHLGTTWGGINPFQGFGSKNALKGNKAITALENIYGRKLNDKEKRIAEEEGYSLNTYLDTKNKMTSGVGQTEEHRKKMFDQVVQDFENKVRKITPSYDDLPSYLQEELLQSTFRGDWTGSPETRKKFNRGEYEEAAKEFLIHTEYLKKDTPKGIKDRIKSVADAIKKYGKEQKTSAPSAREERDMGEYSLRGEGIQDIRARLKSTPRSRMANRAGGGTIDQYFEGQVVGKGDGQSDEILFEVEGKNPDKALLSRDEYVLPADAVAMLGNGSSNAGAKELDRFVKNTRQQGFGTQQQQRRVNPQKGLSALV